MANIAIFRINYKSDFILTLNSDAGWMTPFCIKFWTGAPSRAYFVSFDGITYTHCAPVDGEPTKLLVQFDDHRLPIGDLKFQIGYHFTVADFPTSVEDEVLNQASVIIEVDDVPAQVMLDLNGETAPEIEFSLPAYANEAQRIANEEQRIAAEQQRIANEDARIQAEETRQQNEQQRIDHETARVNEFDTLKSQSQAATRDANDAATLANQKAQLAADKAALANDATTLANQKAQLAADKAALANDAAQLANEKAALAQQKAEYAQQQGGYAKDQGDYAKNQGDYAKAQGDTAQADHERAEADHGIAVDDHTQAGNDHTRAESDHGIAADDHTQAGNDHTRAESDHGIAVDDHTQAGNDHTRAESDHGIAADDHTQAGNDHTRAESDHTRAESDHAAVEMYVDSLGVFDLSKHNAVGGVLATYADLSAALTALNALESKYKYGGMSFKFVQSSDNKYVQYRLMSSSTANADFTNVANWQGTDEKPTYGSKNLVESGGVTDIELYCGKEIDITNEVILKKGYIETNGIIRSDDNWYYAVIFLGAGCTITVSNTIIGNYPSLGIATDENVTIGDTVTVVSGKTYTAITDCWVVISAGTQLNSVLIINTQNIFTENFDSEPRLESKRKILSSENLYNRFSVVEKDLYRIDVTKGYDGYIDSEGTKHSYPGLIITNPIHLNIGDRLYFETINWLNYPVLAKYNNGSYIPLISAYCGGTNSLNILGSYSYFTNEDCDVCVIGKASALAIMLIKKDDETKQDIINSISKVEEGVDNIDSVIKEYIYEPNYTLDHYLTYTGNIKYRSRIGITAHIPCKKGDSIVWCYGKANISPQICACEYDENGNVASDGWVNVVPKTQRTFNVDYDSTKSMRFSFMYKGYDVLPSVTVNGVKVWEYKEEGPVNKLIDEFLPTVTGYGELGDRYPQEIEEIKKYIIPGINKASYKYNNVLHFIHASDNHGGIIKSACDLTDALNGVKFMVITGDIVRDKFSEPFTMQDTILAMEKPCFITIGNHDCVDSNGESTTQGVFNKFIAPLNSHNGIQGNTKTYYSVDYDDEFIKCIYLDMFDGANDLTSHNVCAGYMSAEQIQWFIAELQDAITTHYSVCVFIHAHPAKIGRDCIHAFMDDNGETDAHNLEFLCDIVDAFINGSSFNVTHQGTSYTGTFNSGSAAYPYGYFAGWFCGHTHYDMAGRLQDHPEQFCITIEQKTAWWNTGTYKDGFNDVFNLVTIDSVGRRVGIYRLGSQITTEAVERKSFFYTYGKHSYTFPVPPYKLS